MTRDPAADAFNLAVGIHRVNRLAHRFEAINMDTGGMAEAARDARAACAALERRFVEAIGRMQTAALTEEAAAEEAAGWPATPRARRKVTR